MKSSMVQFQPYALYHPHQVCSPTSIKKSPASQSPPARSAPSTERSAPSEPPVGCRRRCHEVGALVSECLGCAIHGQILVDSHRWPGSKFEEKMSWKCSLESRDSRKDPANANKVDILLSFGSISWRIAEEIIGNLCRCSDKLEILLLDGFACCCSMLQLVLGQWLVVISSLLLYLM